MGRSPHIRRSPFLLLPLALFVFSAPTLDAQTLHASPREALTIILSPALADSGIVLPHQFIIPHTDTLLLDSVMMLAPGREYTIDYRSGTVTLDSGWVSRVLRDSVQHAVLIRYEAYPFRFQESYARRQLIEIKDTTTTDTLRVARPRGAFTVDDIFGPGLQKSGSIVRGFTVGSNRDLSLNSGLRLQMAGQIASDVEVTASLTDESTPIQPEGTTQTLQEFDKVFVEMKGTDFTATLGDFNLDFSGTEFARLNRKLQGAKGTVDYRTGFSSGSVMVSGAAPRGRYNTMQFQGLEGVQGPYRLLGRNNERNIIVIAGTERVYINGELQTRGETNDYTIDYATGEVTFTPRRLITAASRLVIDFEYTDRQYARSLLGAQTSSSFLENRARLTVSFLREADDPDAPVELALTDTVRSILAAAGDDRSKAQVSGVTRVDSNGFYVQVDTVLSDGTPVRFYRYTPGQPDALYNVAFTFVGAGRGEYVRQQIGVFVWRGRNAGDYLPVRILPMPQLQQVVDLALDVRPLSELKIRGEFARSQVDANRFSSIDDGDNGGHAISFVAEYSPRKVTLGGTDIGGFDLTLKERFVDGRFLPVDRANEIEFNRKWGIDTLATADEEIREASLRYMPLPQVSLGGGYGRITRGDAQSSTRGEAAVQLQRPDWPLVSYVLEQVSSRESRTDIAGSWLRQKGSAEYAVSDLLPTFRFEAETRDITSLRTGDRRQGSFAYDLFAPGLKVRGLGKLSLFTEFEWRRDDLFLAGALTRESKSFTQGYGARLTDWNNLTSSVDVTLRDKRFSEAFRQQGNQDITTVLVRSQNRYTPLSRGVDADLFYQVATERTSRLERVFVRVTQGTGNYRYLGDLNNNGIADEFEFELTRFDGDFIAVTVPSDELFPVIDLKTSVRLRLTPRQFLAGGAGGVQGILRALSSETYARVEEKSTERDLKQIYLLRFSRFRRDSTTIVGSTLFTQDLHVFENDPAFSLRLRYLQRASLNRFSTGIERGFARERSIRVRWQLVREIANQIDYTNKIDRVTSEESSSRLRDILGNTIAFDLSYRPEQNVEVGMKLEAGRSTDRFPTPPVDADLNAQTLRIVYAFEGAGQARVEAGREEILLGASAMSFPFELTGGRVAGKTWLWRAAFDYRMTRFIQATVHYDGRSEGGRAPVHTARAEVRAFF